MSKVAVVTGATSGIGRAVALGLLNANYQVAVCGRRVERLDDSFGDVAPDRVLILPCDVRQVDSVETLFTKAVEKFGRVDVVFNNAGRAAPSQPIDEVDTDTWRDMVDTNLNGAFYVARAAFAQMRSQTPQGGRIINNGSIAAYAPRPHSVAYSTTKHAISGLTKSLSLDGRAHNIAAGQIDIGNAATDMTMGMGMTSGVMQANGRTEIEPTFDVRHVVDAVLYMAGLPLDANVQNMTVMATNTPYIGRG